MKTIRCIGQQLKKYAWNSMFLICILAVTALCFTTPVYREMGGTQYLTVIDVLLQYAGNILSLGEKLSAYEIFRSIPGESLEMMVPILVSCSFAVSFCQERRSGFLRFEIIRSGAYRYYLSSMFAALLTGGLILLIGCGLFGITAAVLFPSMADYGIALEATHILTIIKQLVGLFLYGCGSALLPFSLALITLNYYIVVCIPFLVCYMGTIVINWLRGLFDTSLSAFFVALDVSYLQGVLFGSEASTVCFLIYILFAAVIIIFTLQVVQRRVDRGA